MTVLPEETFPVAGVLIGLLLASERRGSMVGIGLTKPLAAAVYVWIAMELGATDSPYGRWVLLALALCWCGDVLLIPRDRPAVFRAGVLAFLLGHVAYVLAFLERGIEPFALGAAAVVFTLPAIAVLRWLAGRVPGALVLPVRIYIGVITAMLAAALATHRWQEAWGILIGAGLFWVSDLFVARDRFVRPGFVNRLVGLPLYFTGQFLLALSVAAH